MNRGLHEALCKLGLERLQGEARSQFPYPGFSQANNRHIDRRSEAEMVPSVPKIFPKGKNRALGGRGRGSPRSDSRAEGSLLKEDTCNRLGDSDQGTASAQTRGTQGFSYPRIDACFEVPSIVATLTGVPMFDA